MCHSFSVNNEERTKKNENYKDYLKVEFYDFCFFAKKTKDNPQKGNMVMNILCRIFNKHIEFSWPS